MSVVSWVSDHTAGNTVPSWVDNTTTGGGNNMWVPNAPQKSQADRYLYPSRSDVLIEMIRSRFQLQLDADKDFNLGFDHIHCAHKDKAAVVLVLVVNGDKHELLEDDVALFPSDTLVTQLRLLAK